MSESTLIASRGTALATRADLASLPVPIGTATHRPIPHIEVVQALIETLGFRHISVVADSYALSHDGNKMFGLVELDYDFTGCRFAIGLRNANDKSMRLALTVGYKVFVCSNMMFNGDFSPVLAKHSKHFNLIDALSIGVDRMQRNFEPLQKTVSQWHDVELTNVEAKGIIYDAVIEGHLPTKLIGDVNHHYFEPEYEEFKDRTLWSLSNAVTSAYKQLSPVAQFQHTAKLNPFLQRFNPPF